MTSDIGKGVKFVAWGQPWALFFQVSQDLEKDPEIAFKMKRPASFSETKFADHVHEVYDKFRNNFPSMIKTLEKVKEDFYNGDSTEKKKAEDADYVQGRIFGWTFGLSLSASTDVYKQYRIISCILQKINILPHEKLDQFQELVQSLINMKETVKVSDCPCVKAPSEEKTLPGEKTSSGKKSFTGEKTFTGEKSNSGKKSTSGEKSYYGEKSNSAEKALTGEDAATGTVQDCLWPRFHSDIKEAKQKGTYQNIHMGMVSQEERETRAGSQVNASCLKVDLEGVINIVQRRAEALTDFLASGLTDKVYTNEEVIVISNCRRLLDLRSMMTKVVESGCSKIATITYRSFKEAATFFEPDLISRIDADELRTQFRQFLSKLEDLSKEKRADQFSSIDILGKFLDPKLELYRS